MCYIVPVIGKLKDYFDCKLYFVVNNYSLKSSINMLELQKIGINNTVQIVTQDQFNSLIDQFIVNEEPCFITSIHDVFHHAFHHALQRNNKVKQIHLSYAHGIDEEIIINGKTHVNILSELLINACLYSLIYKQMIDEIYKIDHNKKTITLFDTTSIWILKRYDPIEKELNMYQREIIDTLLKLKSRYNIILRFHPQDYYGFMNSGKYQCNLELLKHFIINYTPIPVFNLYEIADIIISSRFSASGYQSLFVNNKNLVLLETDFNVRQQYTKDIFINSYTNDQISKLKREGKILSENETYILHENRFNDLLKIVTEIESDNYKCQTEKHKDNFVRKTFGIDRYDFDKITNCNPLDNYLKKWLSIHQLIN